MTNNVIVTGGLGYIGSHSCLKLVEAGYKPIIIDNLSNARRDIFDKLKNLSQNEDMVFIEADVADEEALKIAFETYTPYSVIHFAGLKVVNESIQNPIKYYQQNINTTLNLLKVMEDFDISSLVFSSSANVYGTKNPSPLLENMDVGDISNPYGKSKLMIEEILKDVQKANSNWSIALLRYFNPVGAHPSGLIGNSPTNGSNSLTQEIEEVATSKKLKIDIFGNDYPTRDGTCIRDFIHVTDLASGHLATLQSKANQPGVHIYNLGTGNGVTVLEMIDAYKKFTGEEINYQIQNRRDGDIAISYADITKAKQEIGWAAQKSIEDMVKDSWRWVNKNNVSNMKKNVIEV